MFIQLCFPAEVALKERSHTTTKQVGVGFSLSEGLSQIKEMKDVFLEDNKVLISQVARKPSEKDAPLYFQFGRAVPRGSKQLPIDMGDARDLSQAFSRVENLGTHINEQMPLTDVLERVNLIILRNFLHSPSQRFYKYWKESPFKVHEKLYKLYNNCFGVYLRIFGSLRDDLICELAKRGVGAEEIISGSNCQIFLITNRIADSTRLLSVSYDIGLLAERGLHVQDIDPLIGAFWKTIVYSYRAPFWFNFFLTGQVPNIDLCDAYDRSRRTLLQFSGNFCLDHSRQDVFPIARPESPLLDPVLDFNQSQKQRLVMFYNCLGSLPDDDIANLV